MEVSGRKNDLTILSEILQHRRVKDGQEIDFSIGNEDPSKLKFWTANVGFSESNSDIKIDYGDWNYFEVNGVVMIPITWIEITNNNKSNQG